MLFLQVFPGAQFFLSNAGGAQSGIIVNSLLRRGRKTSKRCSRAIKRNSTSAHMPVRFFFHPRKPCSLIRSVLQTDQWMHTVLRVWTADRLCGLENNIVATGSFLLGGERISKQHISPCPETELFTQVLSRALPLVLFFFDMPRYIQRAF